MSAATSANENCMARGCDFIGGIILADAPGRRLGLCGSRGGRREEMLFHLRGPSSARRLVAGDALC